MRGHDDRGPGPVDPVEHLHDPDRGGRVDVPRRLVRQQDHGPVHERPGHRDPLLLATGQFIGHPVVLAFQPDQVHHLGDDLADEPPGLADHLEGEGDVLVDVLVGQQPEVLEHAPDPAAQVRNLPVGEAGEILAGDVNLAVGRPLLLEDQPQERQLARARGPDQEDELTLLDVDRDVLQGRAALVRVRLSDVIEVDHRPITTLDRMRTPQPETGRCTAFPGLVGLSGLARGQSRGETGSERPTPRKWHRCLLREGPR